MSCSARWQSRGRGRKADIPGLRLHEPIPERIERFAQRAARWVELRRKPVANKRVAIVYYNRSLGKDDMLRGSATGAFFDGPASLMRFLPRLREEGYQIDRVPRDKEQLLGWVKATGRNIGPWAQGEVDAVASRADAVLVPLAKYQQWFDARLTPAQKSQMNKLYGPPPGKLMVAKRGSETFIVLPVVKLGNVILAAQPERGEKQDEKLVHSREVPPPHNYLAFYWWLQDEFKADAVLHWGTHGTLELMPGKEAGLAGDDWSDLLVGTMPVINPWIMDNIGESARRGSPPTT